jgi:hypothetical protein
MCLFSILCLGGRERCKIGDPVFSRRLLLGDEGVEEAGLERRCFGLTKVHLNAGVLTFDVSSLFGFESE